MKKVLALALMMLLSCFAFTEEGYSGTVTISLYSVTGVEEALNAGAEAYEALNPGVDDVVVDLNHQDSYADWVNAMLQSYDDALPEADLVYGNLAGLDRTDKVVNFLDYLGEESPCSDCEDWTEQFAFEMQHIENSGTMWDCISISGVQVLWFYNVEIFEKVGVEPPKTWNEFIAVCAKIQEAGYQPLAVASDFQSFWAEQMGWLRSTQTRPPAPISRSCVPRKATAATIPISTALSPMIPPIPTTMTIPTSPPTAYASGRPS